ncbi:VanZ family protein [Salinirubrum litoreum]|uniref:VanZ family protein n=1 Tax=Salinirubrum litoreum TaxID=1126234 RepID=A0ABD5RCX0_9EURY
MSDDDETGSGHDTDSEPRDSSRRRWLAVAGLVTLGLVGASLVPPALVFGSSPDGGATTEVLGPLGLVGADKWLHGAGYAVLAGTLLPAVSRTDRDRSGLRVVLLAVAVAAGVGLGVELLQWPHPGRTASVADATANLVGAALGAGVAVTVGRRRN